MSIKYHISDVLRVTDANVSLDAELADSTINQAYDMVFFGVGNFLSGNYRQAGDVDEITSNLSVSEASLNKAAFFHITSDTSSFLGGSLSSYGAGITNAGTIFAPGAVVNLTASDDSVVSLSSVTTFGARTHTVMSNISQSTSAASGDALKKLSGNVSSPGDGLLQAATAAIFKKTGKNAAISNDVALVAKINKNLNTAFSNSVKETNSNYSDSKYFQKYLGAGRYESNGADINDALAYDVNDTVFNMVVELTGNVLDTDGSPALTGDNINSIFGTKDTDHLINTGATATGEYSIKALISLRQDDRF